MHRRVGRSSRSNRQASGPSARRVAGLRPQLHRAGLGWTAFKVDWSVSGTRGSRHVFGQCVERLRATGLGGSRAARHLEKAFELLDGRLMLAVVDDIQRGDGCPRSRGIRRLLQAAARADEIIIDASVDHVCGHTSAGFLD